MRRVLTIAVFAVIFLVGLSVLLYPAVSDYYNSLRHVRAVNQYFDVINNLSQQDCAEMLEAAHDYNERLLRKPNRFIMTEEENAEYRSLLNPEGLGVMGMLEIETINIRLPIYHGTDEGVLQVGLGHLEGSSLPVGGYGTHAVITGHRGLPSSTLLTNLDRMVIGDTFRIRVLNETLYYKVDQIKIVLPHETAELAIVSDADYCTLVTCTPIGINTHRLLVRGQRTSAEIAEAPEATGFFPTEGRIFTGAGAALLLIVPVSIAVFALLFVRLRRIYGRGRKR